MAKNMSRKSATKQALITIAKKTIPSLSAKKSNFNLQPITGELSSLLESETPDVSIIIPAYCEEETISEVLQRVVKVSWEMGNVEIIVVDDGSTDQTGEKVKAFPFVKYIRHEINRGKGAAIRTGLQSARGKIFVIQDADLEYLPETIPSIVKPIADGSVDIVYGSRFKGKPEGMTISHYIGNSILSMVARFLYSVKITDIMTGQKAFRRSLLESAQIEENGFAVEIELTCIGFNGNKNQKYTEVPIPYSYRQHGVSKIGYIDGFKSLVKLFTLFLKTEPASTESISDEKQLNNQMLQTVLE
jgi:glycosyltransferase involved in cell wall biosynthesis